MTVRKRFVQINIFKQSLLCYRSGMVKGARKAGRGGKRNVVNVPLLEGENLRLDGVLDGVGLSKTEAVRRILVWFTGQGDLIQKIVLDLHPKDIERPFAKMLRGIADDVESGGIDLTAGASLTPTANDAEHNENSPKLSPETPSDGAAGNGESVKVKFHAPPKRRKKK